MDGQQIGIIALVKSALTGGRAEIPENFDWNGALNTAKKHHIIPMLYYGVQYSGITPPAEIMQFSELATFKNISVSQNQLYALEQIYKAFDENEIDYMPLKGSVLKFVYPKPEMRPMGDADILIKNEQTEKINAVISNLGYVKNESHKGDYDTVWDKKGVLHLELHWNIVSPINRVYYKYFQSGWQFARKENNDSRKYEMAPEDNLVYLFTHFANHYRYGGIGIRHLTDFYIFIMKNSGLDNKKIESALSEMGLLQFYKNVLNTADVWFNGKNSTEITDFITDKIFSSGSYGTRAAHNVSSEIRISGAKGKHRLIKKIFPARSDMEHNFPIVKKHPILIPFLWVFRWVRALLFRRKKIKSEYDNTKNVSSLQIDKYSEELKYVGLGFDED